MHLDPHCFAQRGLDGGAQVDAGFLVGFLLVVGLADGEERDAVLDGEAVVALGDEVGVNKNGLPSFFEKSPNSNVSGSYEYIFSINSFTSFCSGVSVSADQVTSAINSASKPQTAFK